LVTGWSSVARDWQDGQVTGIYDDPWAYELACGFRDVPAEVNVLLGWCARYRDSAPVRTVLELAAGPAEHAREFARRGIALDDPEAWRMISVLRRV
jgi:hypothetical protein